MKNIKKLSKYEINCNRYHKIYYYDKKIILKIKNIQVITRKLKINKNFLKKLHSENHNEFWFKIHFNYYCRHWYSENIYKLTNINQFSFDHKLVY